MFSVAEKPLYKNVIIILAHLFIRKLDSFSQQENITPVTLPVETVTRSLQDLIVYFQASPERIDHETKQNNVIVLKNRQNMFQQEVNIWIDKYRAFVTLPNTNTKYCSTILLFCSGGDRFGPRLY